MLGDSLLAAVCAAQGEGAHVGLQVEEGLYDVPDRAWRDRWYGLAGLVHADHPDAVGVVLGVDVQDDVVSPHWTPPMQSSPRPSNGSPMPSASERSKQLRHLLDELIDVLAPDRAPASVGRAPASPARDQGPAAGDRGPGYSAGSSSACLTARFTACSTPYRFSPDLVACSVIAAWTVSEALNQALHCLSYSSPVSPASSARAFRRRVRAGSDVRCLSRARSLKGVAVSHRPARRRPLNTGFRR